LSEGLDADHIAAQYEHGVLTVTVPVAASAKSRKIAIGLGGEDDSNVLDVQASEQPVHA
jgi:HSP20 family protein